ANELTGDEEIRRNYQVWEVFYRSGMSLAFNARAIRAALGQTLDRFDPGRAARASRRMVLVGHSLGGVIARMLVLDVGDALWRMLLGHAARGEECRRAEAAGARAERRGAAAAGGRGALPRPGADGGGRPRRVPREPA